MSGLFDDDKLRIYRKHFCIIFPNDLLHIGIGKIACSDFVQCNFLMNNERDITEWVERLLWLEQNRDAVERLRPATRAWAERFDWSIIAGQYREMYRRVLARG